MKNSTPDTTKYVNRRERIGGLVYVIMFFIVGAGCCSWLLVSQSDIRQIFSRKGIVEVKMKRQQEFRDIQQRTVADCDIIEGAIRRYDPAVNAVYEKNDIQFMINELKRHHEANRLDKRYMAYLHMSDFYQLWFNDKQYLWSLRSNLTYIRRNLDECELGLERKQRDITGNGRR